MYRKLVPGLIGAAAMALVFTGCSSDPEPTTAPSQFCTDVQAWQNASLQSAKDAIHNGDFSDGNLPSDFTQLIAPLTAVESSLPSDAPQDVKDALTTYLAAMTAEAAGQPPDLSQSAAPQADSTTVSDADLQSAAQTLRTYVTQQCPTTLPSDGSQP